MLNALLFSLLIIFTTQEVNTYGNLSNLRKCADPKCEEKISIGRATQRYFGLGKDIPNFKHDDLMTVYSKEAGTNLDYWGVEVGGRRGYANKKFIKEEKVLVRNDQLTHLVATGFTPKSKENSTQGKSVKSDVKLNSVSENINDESSLNNELKIDPNAEGKTDPGSEGIVDTVHEGKIDHNSEAKVDPVVQYKEDKDANNIIDHNTETKIIGSGHILEDASNSMGEGGGSPVPIILSGEDAEFEAIKPLVYADNSVASASPQSNDSSNVNSEEVQDVDENKVIDDDQIEGKMMDNESEGNGNEGEENGSEHVIKKEGEGEGEGDDKDGNTTVIEATPITEDVPSETSSVIENSEVSLEEGTVQPTPSQKYEVVDGTTIPVEDDSPSLDEGSLNENSLEGSQRTNEPHTNEPTPYPGMAITQPPIMLRNFDKQNVSPDTPIQSSDYIVKETKESFNSQSVNTIEQKVNSVPEMTKEEEKHPEQIDTPLEVVEMNPDVEEVSSTDFSTLKPESIMEDKKEHSDENVGIPAKEGEASDIPTEQSQHNAGMSIEQSQDNTGMPTQIEESSNVPTERLEHNAGIPLEQSQDNADIPAENIPDNVILKQNEDSYTMLTEQSEGQIDNQSDMPSVPSENNADEFENKQGISIEQSGDNINQSVDNAGMPTPQSEDKEQQQPEASGGFFSNMFSNSKIELKEANPVEERSAETQSESDIEPLIANLPFADPDAPKSGEEVLEEPINLPNEAVLDDGSSDALPENNTGMDTPEESDVLTLKDQLLDASGPLLNEGMALAIEGELAEPHLSTGTVTFLLVVAGTIVALYFSHLIVIKISRESPLLEGMNQLDRSRRILVEENNNLKRRLTQSNGQLKSGTNKDPLEIQRLKEQLREMEMNHESSLCAVHEKNAQLESDIEVSTTNEVELHRMLNELLSNQKETSNFEDSVNSLQTMLDGQKDLVENLTSDLALKTRLNDELRNELKASKSKMSKLEYQIEQLSHSMEDVTSSKQEYLKRLTEEENSLLSLKGMNASLREEVDRMTEETKVKEEENVALKEIVKKIKKKFGNKDAECQVTRECLKKLQLFSDGGGNDIQAKLADLFRITEVKTQLATCKKEGDSMKSELEESERLRTSLEERVRGIEEEVSHLRESGDNLQKERDEAKAKLGVLTQYYEEKEAQLKKELESQEGLLHTVEGSAAVVSNRIQTYEMELTSCRSQIESLKTELEEQKQSYKIQLTNEEKKLHDSWLTARSAERRQEELRQENTQLRQKLTHIQRDVDRHIIKPSPKRVDANGSVSSPISMDQDMDPLLHPGLPLNLDGGMPHLPPPPMMPMFQGRPPLPPHGMPPGLPPPPMHPHMFGHLPPHPPMPDRRMPPAGRIASPPGYDRRSYSPGSDYSDQRYSPGPRYSPGHHHPRQHSPDRKSEHSRRAGNSRRDLRSPSPSADTQQHSPSEQWYTQSPQGGYAKHRRTPPPPSIDYYDGVNDSRRHMANPGKGKKTSTPLGPNDR